jgi:rod shape-determining protein MreC
MARLPERASRFLLIATFILCLSILFLDFRFGTFKPVQNIYNSSTIFIQTFSSEYITRPFLNLFTSIWDGKRAKEENLTLREELNKQLIINYIISNTKILNRNIFFDVTNFDSIDLKLLPAKVAIFDVNQYRCCDKHRMFLVPEAPSQVDSFKVVINPEGIVGQTIKINKSLFEVILLSDKSHKIPIQNEKEFYCEASGLGVPKKIYCDVDLTLGERDFEVKQKIFSSGLGGVFPKGIEVGSIDEIQNLSSKEVRLIVELNADPLASNYFGVLQ